MATHHGSNSVDIIHGVDSVHDLGSVSKMGGVHDNHGVNSLDSVDDTAKHEQLNGSDGMGRMNGTTTNGDSYAALEAFAGTDGIAPPPIAVVGMGLRLPGQVNGEGDFWDLLVNKMSGRGLIPKNRFNVDAFYSSTGGKGSIKTKHGYFLDHDLQDFDASFFSMGKAEVEKLDPQQRLLLEVVWECMENGGQVAWRGEKIGCFVGSFGEDWLDMAAKDTQFLGHYRVSGSGDYALSNRVSYEYDLKGPSMTIRTGCSSSLIGLHEACQAIYGGECESAIVAGTNLIITPTMTIAMTEQGVLSPTGLCKTFDANADGYARGEAVNAVYVKKLSDALRDGDPIRAVIRSTATNCDGKTPGMTVPSSESHESMIRRAYQVAKLADFSKTAFVECHGTGTAIGDPLEANAVANDFGRSGVLIGSVKTNVGHSEGASGITSLIKTVLALEHRLIPPNLNFQKGNPKIPWEKARLRVPLAVTQWPENCERASINSFGIGGANAHAIVDSAASFGVVSSVETKDSPSPRSQLLVFSANHPDSLTRSVAEYQEIIDLQPHLLKDLAYTLGNRREHLAYRSFCVTDGDGPLKTSAAVKSKSAPQVAFVFTGQGAQWSEMAKQLLEDFSEFRDDIRAMDKAIAGLSMPPPWTIEGELAQSKSNSRIDEAEFSQPLCTALQIGLVNLLRSWGVLPAVVLGHSSGEIAAAYASGAISAEAAIIIAYYRGQVSKRQVCSGAMLAVGMGPAAVAQYLIEGVEVACVNSPESVTLSGDKKQINKVAVSIADNKPGMFVRPLKVAIAYHSNHMREVGAEYLALLETYVATEGLKVPFFSSVTGHEITDSAELGASYWRKNLESPVLFSSAAQAALDHLSQNRTFLEIGPHSALAGPLRQIFKSLEGVNPPSYVPSIVRCKNVKETLLSAVGELHLQNVPVNFKTITSGKKVLTNLPPYPWRYEKKYWKESRIVREWRQRSFPRHEILGSRVLEGNDLEPTWRNMLSLQDVSWISDHKIIDDIVFPAAGYITMAGEAIRQLTEREDFTIRNLSIGKALVLHDSTTVEMMTNFHRKRLTTSLDSDWYEFIIYSYNGTLWTKNCTGEVRAGREQALKGQEIDNLPREVLAPSWYSAMKRVGLNYGPAFQGLTDISADASSGTSVASLVDKYRSRGYSYQFHPTTIDLTLQLFTVATAGGAARKMTKLYVPTAIEEIYIRQGHPEMQAKIIASAADNGSIRGDAVVKAGQDIVIQLLGGEFSPLEDQLLDAGDDPIAGAQLEWKPDIAFLRADKLIRPVSDFKDVIVNLERLTILCILETHHRLSHVETEVEHLKKFKAWVTTQADRARSGSYHLIKEARSFAQLDYEMRQSAIEGAKSMLNGVSAEIGKSLLEVLENCEAIFSQQANPLDTLMRGNKLKTLYKFFSDMSDLQGFFTLLSHAEPNLRILEIGAGTGGTTQSVLKNLVTVSGERKYSEYCFTDISAGFFVQAREQFKDFQNITYATLDISKDPIEQGFQECSFDLILASNVLHATPSIGETLHNVRKLLDPNGRLLLQELSPTARLINFIMGILPGWWLGEKDGRPNEPYISVERWDRELRAAGFSGTDSVVFDNDQPYHLNAIIVSSLAKTTEYPKIVTLLHKGEISPLVKQAADVFSRNGLHTEFSSIDQQPPTNQDIISLVDLDGPFFDNISSENLATFQTYVGNLNSSGMLWVTQSSQIGCKDPRYGQVLGVARTIRSELLIDFASIELDTLNDVAFRAVLDVFQKFQKRTKGGKTEPDWEYALSEGEIKIPRYHWLSIAEKLSRISEAELPRKLEIGKPGLLQTLRWVQTKDIVLADDQVEFETHAVGMNFRDVLVCMGVVQDGEAGIGLEAAGIVRSTGSKVTDLKVGDRVIAFKGGCCSTRVALSAKLCTKIPDGLSYEEAATLPCVYSTVIHALLTLGRLEKGHTVLIQSACGGVGLAAIQICQMVGAEIFATVSNEEKIKYLVETFGLSRHHIFNSRDSSFLTDVKEQTNGRGVDMVLNSLSGELLHASWNCVAEGGKMLEISKRDFVGRGMLSMDLFKANRSFFGIDLAQISVERPAECRALLEQCIEFYRQGAVGPIKPMQVFPATQIYEAFKYFQKGQHIGKIVVTMPESPQELELTAVKQDFRLRPEASYLLVGGLGGLGRAIANWMVESGARNLIFLSRSAGKSDADKRYIHDLETQGCSVQSVCGDVTKLDDVESVVEHASAPIAGVMHMSMVLRDRRFLEFTHEEWRAVVDPKVQGAWNLHKALTGRKLDFFILFSSISCVVGNWGQGNYAAANTFLNSFVQYRQGLGEAASVIDIGVMEDVGYVSQNPVLLEQFRAMGVHTLQEQDLMDSLQFSMAQSTAPLPTSSGFRNPAQLIIGLKSSKPLSDPSNRVLWKRDVRMSLYRYQEAAATSSGGKANENLKGFLTSVGKDPSMLNDQSSIDFLTREIKASLCNIMLLSEEDVDVNQSLSALGADSLVAIEIRNWWRQSLGLELSVLEIMSSGSIEQLGKVASEGLQKRHKIPAAAGESASLLTKAP